MLIPLYPKLSQNQGVLEFIKLIMTFFIIFFRYCVSNHNCNELMFAITMSFFEDRVTQCFSLYSLWLLYPFCLFVLSSAMFLDLSLSLSYHHSYLLSELWIGMSLCINKWPLQKETPDQGWKPCQSININMNTQKVDWLWKFSEITTVGSSGAYDFHNHQIWLSSQH